MTDQIKEVSVSIKRTINLGNYENVVYECGVVYTVNLDKGETPDNAYDTALEFCKSKVIAEVDRLAGK